jgi:hypothetical protein
VPILHVGDIGATLRWYTSIGFTEVGRYPEDGSRLFWGMVSLGRAEIMFEPGSPDAPSTTLLFVTDRINDVHETLKERQLQIANATETGSNHNRSIRFVENLHEPIFGGLQFSIQDPNGYVLRFLQHEREEESR